MTLFAFEWNWNAFGMALLAAAAFGLLGIALLMLGFKVFERITPKLDVEQKLQEGSIAVGIVTGALLIAIAIVVAAAIQG
jgi:putative membrane protein